MIRSFLLVICLSIIVSSFAQTSDDAFKKPLKDVIADIENRYHVKIRYSEDLVKDRW